jgi:hypothetical protein
VNDVLFYDPNIYIAKSGNLTPSSWTCFARWLFPFSYHHVTACLKNVTHVTCHKRSYYVSPLRLRSWGWLLALSPYRWHFWHGYLILRSQNSSRKIIPWRVGTWKVFLTALPILRPATLPCKTQDMYWSAGCGGGEWGWWGQEVGKVGSRTGPLYPNHSP